MPRRRHPEVTPRPTRVRTPDRPTLTRRQFFIGAGCAALGCGGVAAAAVLGLRPTDHSQDYRSVPAGEMDKTINTGIRQLNIPPSFEEVNLWGSRPDLGPLTNQTLDRQTMIDLAVRRLEGTLDLMLMSKNKYFHDTVLYVNTMIKFGLLTLEIDPEMQPKGGFTTVMSTQWHIVDGALKWRIVVSARALTSNLEGINFAGQLAHEKRHLVDFRDDITKMPGKTAQEQSAILEQRKQDDPLFLLEEARGYADQARAYLVEAALYYPRRETGTPDEQLAAQFVKANYDETNPGWLAYIKSRLPQ